MLRLVPVPTDLRENEKMSNPQTLTVPTLLHSALIFSALLLLSSCGSDPSVRVVTETEIVEVPVEVYKPLPETLTRPLNYPDSVVFGVDGDITIDDLLDMVFDLLDTVDTANKDRASSEELTTPDPVAEPLP